MERAAAAAARQSSDPVRRLAPAAVLSIAAVGAACAAIAAPPGGPVRTTPPVVVLVTPDSGAVNVDVDNVVFTFDAVVNDRPSGPRDMESAFLVSPSEGRPRVRWRRDRIEVRPREGFRDSTAYSVTMLPGIADLRGNVQRTPRTIIFSTGPAIPPFAIHGRMFDWMSERPAANGFLEATRLPDSLRYVAVTDSSGQFRFGPLTEGRYVVRGFMDANANRERDTQESWDSVVVTVRASSPFVEVLAAPRDTIAPRLLTVTVQDSLTLVAAFDRPLDPNLPLTAANFLLVSTDSAPLAIASVRTREQQVRLDSARADSIARADTTARPDTVAAAPGRRPAAPPGVIPEIQPRPTRPAPAREAIIVLDAANPLQRGGSYRLTARSMRGLLGALRTSDRAFVVPAARPAADSTAAPPTAVPPTGTPP